MADELTPGQKAAALHGWASNRAVPLEERLQAALQALNFYEAETERLQGDRDYWAGQCGSMKAQRDDVRTVLAAARESDDWDPGAMVMLYDTVVNDRDEAAAVITKAQQALGTDHPVFWILDEYDGSGDTTKVVRKVIDAAVAYRNELVQLGRWTPGEAAKRSSAVRSDRWPPEVNLIAAVDKLLDEPTGT